MKRWSLGTYHGLRRKHVDTYLNEFVFRYNRRFYRHVSFETLLGLAADKKPASYWDLIKRDNPRKSAGRLYATPLPHIDEPELNGISLADPKGQHFIPCVHLRHFAGHDPKGQVWTFNKNTGAMWSAIPEETAKQTQFYSIQTEDEIYIAIANSRRSSMVGGNQHGPTSSTGCQASVCDALAITNAGTCRSAANCRRHRYRRFFSTPDARAISVTSEAKTSSRLHSKRCAQTSMQLSAVFGLDPGGCEMISTRGRWAVNWDSFSVFVGGADDPTPVGSGMMGQELKKIANSLLIAFVVSVSTNVERSFADTDTKSGTAPQAQELSESYALPITPPLHQGDTGLCWMFATLSMLETNYRARHPGSQISLSRGAMQVEALEDRLERLVRGELNRLPEGGLAVEAIALIRKDGMVAQSDFRDILNSNRLPSRSKRTLLAFPIAEARKRL